MVFSFEGTCEFWLAARLPARDGAEAHSNEGSSASSVRSLTESSPPRPLGGRCLDPGIARPEALRGPRPMANFPELRPDERSAEAESLGELRNESHVRFAAFAAIAAAIFVLVIQFG